MHILEIVERILAVTLQSKSCSISNGCSCGGRRSKGNIVDGGRSNGGCGGKGKSYAGRNGSGDSGKGDDGGSSDDERSGGDIGTRVMMMMAVRWWQLWQ